MLPPKPNKPPPEQADSAKHRAVAPMPLVMRDNADKVLPPKGYFSLKICSEQGAGSQVICAQIGPEREIHTPDTKKAAPKDRLNILDVSHIRM